MSMQSIWAFGSPLAYSQYSTIRAWDYLTCITVLYCLQYSIVPKPRGILAVLCPDRRSQMFPRAHTVRPQLAPGTIWHLSDHLLDCGSDKWDIGQQEALPLADPICHDLC